MGILTTPPSAHYGKPASSYNEMATRLISMLLALDAASRPLGAPPPREPSACVQSADQLKHWLLGSATSDGRLLLSEALWVAEQTTKQLINDGHSQQRSIKRKVKTARDTDIAALVSGLLKQVRHERQRLAARGGANAPAAAPQRVGLVRLLFKAPRSVLALFRHT